MKEKLNRWAFIGFNVMTVTLLFSILDHSTHVLKDAWSVPDFYFEDKIPFGFFWALVGLYLARKRQGIWAKAAVFSATIAIILQFRYLVTGYDKTFVFLFMFFHFAHLYFPAVAMFAVFRKYLPTPANPIAQIYKKHIGFSFLVMALVAVGTYFVIFDKNISHGNIHTSYEYTPTDMNNPVVAIKDFVYGPTSLTIKKGTTVTWVNSDTAPHTVTSISGNLLDSPTLQPGESWSFTFTESGMAEYLCAFHPMMKGSIEVTE